MKVTINKMKNNIQSESFELAGETFQIKYFPNLYAMTKTSPTNTETQLRSVADAWHDGDIVSAAQALESDLGSKQ